MSSFVEASREKTFLKAGIMGPSGGGKSFTALILAHALKAAGLGKRVAVIDAENGKIKKYAKYRIDDTVWDFSVSVLTSYGPNDYCTRIQEAQRLGFDIIVIDGISQEWAGKNGALETVDQLSGKNAFTSGWKAVTPMHNSFIESILAVPAHVICTIRSKMGYMLEEVEKNGKTISVPKRIGMEPIQRNGIEYEFEVLFDISTDHIIRVAKTICPTIDGATTVAPKAAFFQPLVDWLAIGDEVKVEFAYSFIGAERVNEIVQRIAGAGASVDAERDWIFNNFGARGFDQLTDAQAKRYSDTRLAMLEDQSRARATSTPTSTSTSTAKGETLHDAMAQAAPEASTPIVDSKANLNAAYLGSDPKAACRILFEELTHLLNVPADQKEDVFKASVLDRFNVKSIRDLSDSQFEEIKNGFMRKIHSIYIERGTPDASPFHAAINTSA